MLIRIVPLGNVSSDILEEISFSMKNIFNSKARILGKIDVPKDSFNHWRKQYDAEKILDSISNLAEVKFIDKTIPTLAITDSDIFYKHLNFAFSIEDPEKGFMMVSIARLKPEFYDEQPDMLKLKERAVKEAIHNIGHYLGFGHCVRPECIMYFSPSVNDIDKKGKNFCETCKNLMRAKGVYL